MRPQAFQILALLGISAGIALGQTQSTFTLQNTPNQTNFGSPVTLTATLSPPGGALTVTFRDGGQTGTPIGNATMNANSGVATFTVSNLSPGGHSLVASITPVGTAGPRFSNTVSQFVFTNFTLGSSPNPSTVGGTVTFTATANPPTGALTVTFRDGGQTGTPIGNATMNPNSGSAIFQTSSLAAGTHQIVASYSDPLNDGVARFSNTVPQTVNQLTATTTALVNSPNPSTLCQSVTLTATVTRTGSSNFNLTGNIVFFDGQAQVGAAGINVSPSTGQGSASATVVPLTAGNHSFTATYTGDSNFASSSGSQTQVVTRATPTVSLSSLPNPSNPGQNVTMTATVPGCTNGNTTIPVTGSVTFLDGGATTLSNVNLSNGTATFQTTALTSGTHPLTARYNGDTNFGANTSATVNQVVGSNTTISLAANPNPSTVGQTVTITATITPNTATGNVQFFDNGSTLLGQASVISGTASFQISTLAVGSHSLTATLAGSTSAAVPLTVNKANTTTTLAANPAASNPGQTVTFTATVAPSGATGQVQFRDSGVPIGTGNLSNGTATFATANLAAGAHTITAVYAGDTNFNTSTSNPVNISVGQGTSSTNLTVTPNPAGVGQQVTMTATVSPATATGTVAFRDNGVTIQNVTLTNGTAIFVTSNLPAGIHILTAVYSGNSVVTGSTSAAFNEVVGLTPTTTTLTALPIQSTFGQAVNLVTTVTPNNATGTITYRDGTDVVGTAPLNGGTATFSTSSLTVGSHSIIASYPGDNTFANSASAPVTVQVNPGTTTTVLTATPTSVSPGQGVLLNAKVTPVGATGSVTFRDGTNTIGTANIVGGSASTTVSNLPTGSHSLTAAYNGDNNFAPSTSSPVTVTVGTGPACAPFPSDYIPFTSVAYTSNANSAGDRLLVGSMTTANFATLQQTIPLPTGVNQQFCGAVQLAGGSFAVAYVPTAAERNGDFSPFVGLLLDPANNNQPLPGGIIPASRIPALFAWRIVSTLDNTTTTLTVAPPTPNAGQSVTLTATIIPAGITGVVTFMDGSASLGTGNVNNGTATFSTSSLAAGSHSLTAVYGGDAKFAPSTSAAVALTIGPGNTLRITAPTALPAATVNAPYSQTFTATGGTGTLTWTISAGTVPGLTMSTGGVLSGIPTTAGTTQLTVRVQDSTGASATTVLSLTVVNSLLITTTSPLPQAIVNVPYTVTLTATGGTGTLTWTLFAGTVPGLSLSAGGVLSGTPTAAGTTQLTIRVQDNSGSANATVLGLTVLPTPSPSISVTQPTTTADQPAPQVTLAFPMALNATFTLSFTPNAASLPANFVNGSVQFASGGITSPTIAIPANSTAPAVLPAVQLGTVAGTITVRLATLTTSTGQSVLPASPPSTTITVPRLAPVIVPGSVRITSVTSTGFTVFLNASSTPRDLTSANLTFTAAAGTQLNGGQSTVTLTSPAVTWFTSTAGVTNGGSFSVTMPFAFSGDISALGTVSVTLANSVGTSTPVSGGR